MKKIAKYIFILVVSIIMIVLSIKLLFVSYIEESIICLTFGILLLYTGLKFIYETLMELYSVFVIKYGKRSSKYQNLTDEEMELIEDAKKLIKKVDESIIISKFNVYKVKFLKDGMFNYDEENKELDIYIPFRRFLKYSKDLCFLAVVHEILHSQNLKDNQDIFCCKFNEGLNQFFTEWLINNYSEKYKIPDRIRLIRIRVKKDAYISVYANYKIYEKEVKIVKDILEQSKMDIKEVFLKYIDINPEFFKEFVPAKYFSKQ